ncbi:MAG: SH3 domain-containing protein [Clostridia bacterium]|nr:SH3 domain-containing protein [Clostridia bacterium]
MKKFFAVMLALTLVLVSIPAFASARVIVPNNICRPYYGRPCGYYAAPVCYGDPVIPNLTYFVPGEAYCAPVYPAFVPAYRVPAKKAPAIILNPELVKVEKTVAATSLNVRKGPGTDYEVLGSLKSGTTVTVESYYGSWALIAYGSGYAYVSAAYLK